MNFYIHIYIKFTNFFYGKVTIEPVVKEYSERNGRNKNYGWNRRNVIFLCYIYIYVKFLLNCDVKGPVAKECSARSMNIPI